MHASGVVRTLEAGFDGEKLRNGEKILLVPPVLLANPSFIQLSGVGRDSEDFNL
jgi:hypothetical protein